jgi:hypothetical protein
MYATELADETDRAAGLTGHDVEILEESVDLLPTSWRANAMSSEGRTWSQFVRPNRRTNVSPTVHRTDTAYVVMIWDIVTYMAENEHEVVEFQEIDAAIGLVQCVSRELIETDDSDESASTLGALAILPTSICRLSQYR